MQIFFISFLSLLSLSLGALKGSQVKEPWLRLEADRCTSIIMGKNAGLNGPMTTHTADCADCDFRLSRTPAKHHPAGSMRPLFLYTSAYPSLVTEERGETWKRKNLEGSPQQLSIWKKNGTEVVGYIPQVPYTYSLVEGGYGIMNEHQVAIGESTCAAKLWTKPFGYGGSARIEARELTLLALERTKTAREAVQLMGDLGDALGFYGADWSGGDLSKGEAGEALTVVDTKEAWIFHIMPDDTGKSSVWVAQRVPDNHVAVVANQFVIRKVPNEPNDDFLFSKNLHGVAQRLGWWNPSQGELDFIKVYAPPRSHAAYATRRVWRILSWLAPSLNLDPYEVDKDPFVSSYPVSVAIETTANDIGVLVDEDGNIMNEKELKKSSIVIKNLQRKLRVEDVIKLQRDHYEGTAFDLTKGTAAGPYGDPNRFDIAPIPSDNLNFEQVLEGAYERSISLFRTSYSLVAEPRYNSPNILARVWLGQYAPSASAFLPMYVQSLVVPAPYSTGSLFKYNPDVAFWSFASVGNYASRFYKYAMQDVFEAQEKVFNEAVTTLDKIEEKVLKILYSIPSTKDSVTFSNSYWPLLGQSNNETTLNNLEYSTVLKKFQENDVNFIRYFNESIADSLMSHWLTTIDQYEVNSHTKINEIMLPVINTILTAASTKEAYRIINTWKDLFPSIIAKYHDGYIMHGGPEAISVSMEKLFYPKSWLDATGYWNNKPYKGDGVILFAPGPQTSSSMSVFSVVCLTALFSSILTGLALNYYQKKNLRAQYMEI